MSGSATRCRFRFVLVASQHLSGAFRFNIVYLLIERVTILLIERVFHSNELRLRTYYFRWIFLAFRVVIHKTQHR